MTVAELKQWLSDNAEDSDELFVWLDSGGYRPIEPESVSEPQHLTGSNRDTIVRL